MARSLHRLIKIQADTQGNAPTTIELLRVGNWHTPWHGDFEITPSDIEQFAANAEAGVGLVADDKRIPINYGHTPSDKAAGWITRVYASDDGQALLGDPKWTPAGKQALADDEWRYISAEFNPRSWPWEDAEEEYHFVNNVIDGAALTNIPLFKKLKPVTASRITGSNKKTNEGDDDMDLSVLRAKKKEELKEGELKFVEEHKAELTEDERKAFGLEDAGETEAEKTAREEKEAKEAKDKADKEEKDRLEASRNSGNVSISADRLAKLEADAKAGLQASETLAKKDAEAIVDRHISAGQIKSDQRDASIKMLLASRGDERKGLESFMAALPESKVLASEIGSGAHREEEATVSDQEKALAESFGNTPEEIANFKKAQS